MTENNTCGCGCGDHAGKPVNPEGAGVREEIKIVPADGSVDNVAAPAEGAACGCGHEAGQCSCGHHHGAAADTATDAGSASKYDETIGRDTVNADIDGEVTTVEEAEHHVEGRPWNDGNLGTEAR